MCENIEITKEEMWSKRFEDFHDLLDEMDNMQLAYIIRGMTKYIDSDKKYVWIMSESVETRLLNAMYFPEILIVDGKISYLLGYPVVYETFLSVEKNRDSAEEYGEVIAYPYIWLKEGEVETSVKQMELNKTEFMLKSYDKINSRILITNGVIANIMNAYKMIFKPTTEEEIDTYREELRAHLRQFL